MMRGSLDRPKKNSAKENLDTAQTKKGKGALDSSHSEAKPNHGNEPVHQSDTNMGDISPSNMQSLDKAKSNGATGSFERVKLKPIRANLNTDTSKVKPTYGKDKVQESSTNMDGMTLPDMLRFLDKEEALLKQLQSKMSDELSRLQVEEHVFLHALKILNQKHAPNKGNENQQQSSSGDQELIDALNEALTQNGDSVAGNLDKGEETSEE